MKIKLGTSQYRLVIYQIHYSDRNKLTCIKFRNMKISECKLLKNKRNLEGVSCKVMMYRWSHLRKSFNTIMHPTPYKLPFLF